MSKLAIAEQFYSVQGEGPHAGTPALFLRLAGCNLSCGLDESTIQDFEPGQQPEGDASWVCDTIDVWRAAEETLTGEEAVSRWEDLGWLQRLSRGAHLILTGGEPTLARHVEPFLDLYAELIRNDVYPFVEVETNGTLVPDEGMSRYVDQWNVSLKLSNSGMDVTNRLNRNAINEYRWTHEDEGDTGAVFKFVVSKGSDVDEILDIIDEYSIPDSMVMLMPAGQTQEQLRMTYPLVAEYCKAHNWQFSPRLHVDTWNQATGV